MQEDPLKIINREGYVTLVEGEPGLGKTSLALAACAKRVQKPGCEYISFAEPESSIRKKLSRISRKKVQDFKFFPALTGDVSMVFSEIIKGLQDGLLVVVDSLDALMFSIKSEEEMRSFLQILYGASKNKKGSLLLISENVNPSSKHIRFICDALIKLERVEVLGSYVRRAIVQKDRDSRIVNPYFYYTLSDTIKIYSPFELLTEQKYVSLKSYKRPKEGSVEAEQALGYNILYEVDPSVSDLVLKVFRRTLAADFINRGLKVNYWLGPQESEEEVYNDLKKLIGEKVSGLKTVFVDPQEFDYNPEEYLKYLVTTYGKENAVDLIHLLLQEDFAVKQPQEYERFVKNATKENLKLKRITISFGYTDQEALRIRAKYSNVLRKITIKDGFLFWRSMRPLGNVYIVDLKLKSGRISFEEMY